MEEKANETHGSFLLTVSISLCVPVGAAERADVQDEPKMLGVLTADDGAQYIVEGVLVETNDGVAAASLDAVDTEEVAMTYKFAIPASVTAGSGSITEGGSDTNSLTEAFLTVHFRTREVTDEPEVSGINEYLLTRVSGYWAENSPNIYVSYGSLDYYCYKNEAPGSRQEVLSATVSNYFDVSTGFSEYVYSSIAMFGATLVVHVTMGSRNWTFQVVNQPSVS